MLQSWSSCGILRCTASGLWWALGCCLRCCICLQACQNLRTLPILPRFWAPWGLCHRDPQGSTGNMNLWFIEAMLSYQKVQVLVIAFYCFLACVCVCVRICDWICFLYCLSGPKGLKTLLQMQIMLSFEYSWCSWQAYYGLLVSYCVWALGILQWRFSRVVPHNISQCSHGVIRCYTVIRGSSSHWGNCDADV